jgi:hypothetical protein
VISAAKIERKKLSCSPIYVKGGFDTISEIDKYLFISALHFYVTTKRVD